MVFGIICSCCGEKVDGDDASDASNLFMCQPCAEDPAAAPPDLSVHTIPTDTGVVVLEASTAFNGLTAKEQAYALGLSKADWEGAKICLIQCSPESASIFALLQLAFSAQPVSELCAAAKAKGVTDDEVAEIMIYCASIYGNLGNYKSFGDTKFVPAAPPHRFRLFLSSSGADAGALERLWQSCATRMYSLAPRQRQLGLGATKGISTYFSANCDEGDADLAGRFLESKQVRVHAWHTCA